MTMTATGNDVLTDRSGRERTAVIAGSGDLPRLVAERLAENEKSPFVIVVEGEAEQNDFSHLDHVVLAIEEVGSLLPALRRAGCSRVIMAGGIERRPRILAIRWNAGLLLLLPRIMRALARGDDGLLRAIVEHLEGRGLTVLGAHEIVPDMLAPEGPLTTRRPGKAAARDIDAAVEAALAIGRLDIGQAAIAVGGRCIALEGIEGTDGLLERMKEMRAHGRLGGRKGGVLVKCAKPGQELRADLPAIGPATVEKAHAADLTGIAVEADRTFVLDFGRTVARAEELGLFIIGIATDGKQ